MKASRFISRRIGFKSRAASISIAVSFVVMILAIAIADGFRTHIYAKLSEISGDIIVSPAGWSDEVLAVEDAPDYCWEIEEIEGVQSACPVLYSAGMIKSGSDIHGVVFKAVDSGWADGDSSDDGMEVMIPRKLARLMDIGIGDTVNSYFVGSRVVIRKFTVGGIYDGIVTDDDKLVVMCEAGMLRRVMGYGPEDASAIEVLLQPSMRDQASATRICDEISFLLYEFSHEESTPLAAHTVRSRYSQLFDWLGLVDLNVSVILVLMVIVAAFNLISALLILLFQHISTIGILKTMGMNNKAIAGTFLLSSARLVGVSVLAANAIAFALVWLQSRYHLISLDPDNYFIDYVPVELNLPFVLIAQVVAFAVIMLLLQIPCVFISRVDASVSADYR